MRKKHKLLAGLASLTLFDIAAANAAPPQIFNWQGFYIGGHTGMRSADATFTGAPSDFDFGFVPVSFPGRMEGYSLGSAIVGLQGGYNFLINPMWLVGIEGDFSGGWGDASSSAELTVFDSTNDSYLFRRTSIVKLGWQGTIRGRIGYVSGPWLFYGTGGVAFIHVKWSDSSFITALSGFLPVDPTIAAVSASKVLTGGVAGFGVEYMFSPMWTGRVEYLYENFGGFNTLQGFGPQIGRLGIGDVHVVRFGLNYKVGP